MCKRAAVESFPFYNAMYDFGSHFISMMLLSRFVVGRLAYLFVVLVPPIGASVNVAMSDAVGGHININDEFKRCKSTLLAPTYYTQLLQIVTPTLTLFR